MSLGSSLRHGSFFLFSFIFFLSISSVLLFILPIPMYGVRSNELIYITNILDSVCGTLLK